MLRLPFVFFFFFNDTATTEIYPLSLHDALPISCRRRCPHEWDQHRRVGDKQRLAGDLRSEEHTSELQSRQHLVCRLLLEHKETRGDHTPGRTSPLPTIARGARLGRR